MTRVLLAYYSVSTRHVITYADDALFSPPTPYCFGPRSVSNFINKSVQATG